MRYHPKILRTIPSYLRSDGRDSCGVVSAVGGGKFDPRLSTLRKLAQALEVSVCDLIDQPKTNGGKSHGSGTTKRRVVRAVSRRR